MLAWRLLTYTRKVIPAFLYHVVNVNRQGFGNVCCCRVVFAKIGSLVRCGFDSSYIQIYPPALVCTELHNRKKVREVIRRTPCHVCCVCMPAVGRKSFSLGRTSVLKLCLKNQQRKAVANCTMFWWLFRCRSVLRSFQLIPSIEQKGKKKYQNKTNKT